MYRTEYDWANYIFALKEDIYLRVKVKKLHISTTTIKNQLQVITSRRV